MEEQINELNKICDSSDYATLICMKDFLDLKIDFRRKEREIEEFRAGIISKIEYIK